MMQQMTLSPCNNPRVNAVMTYSITCFPTADRGFKRQLSYLNAMVCEKRGTVQDVFAARRSTSSGFSPGRRCGPQGVAPLTLCMVPHPRCTEWNGFAIGCHGWKTPWYPNQLSSRSEGGRRRYGISPINERRSPPRCGCCDVVPRWDEGSHR